jgi:hypothetical protein
MCHFPAKWLLLILCVTWGIHLSAQTGTSSTSTNSSNPLSGRENNPYSKYGIGEFWNGNNTVLRGMGNITSAFENPYEVNSDNPASYSFLQRTTFEAGMMASTRSIAASGGYHYTTGTASIAYLNLGIPVNKNSGLCLGFRPYTRSYYSLIDTITGSPIGTVARSYNGEGSLNYAYLGAAVKYKGLSVGFNAGYMFGTFHNSSLTIPIDDSPTNRAYIGDYTNFTRIGGIYWKGGLMYERKIDSDYTFRVGGTFTISQNITERLSAYQISNYNFGDTIVNDTSSRLDNVRGALRLPLSYSIGVMIVKNDKWGLGLDYTATQWSTFNSTPDTSLKSGIGSSSYKISIGGEYTPNANNIRNYFSRVTYRLGFYYGNDYLNLNNNTLPYYGITAGTSLPFRRSLSKLHFSLDVGRLGTTANNLLQETYIRFTLGISFNDRWFIPRKYD